MGFLNKIFASKHEPEWLNVGEIGDDYETEMKRHAQILLQKKGRHGWIPTAILEYKPGFFGQTTEELHNHVFKYLAGIDSQLPPEAREAINKGDVCFMVGRFSSNSAVAGCRCVGVVIME